MSPVKKGCFFIILAGKVKYNLHELMTPGQVCKDLSALLIFLWHIRCHNWESYLKSNLSETIKRISREDLFYSNTVQNFFLSLLKEMYDVQQ